MKKRMRCLGVPVPREDLVYFAKDNLGTVYECQDLIVLLRSVVPTLQPGITIELSVALQ